MQLQLLELPLRISSCPDSVTSIGEGAFAGCIGLANKLGLVIVRNTLFDYVGAAKDVIIPDTVI